MKGTPKRSGVAGLYIDTHHIYYSCIEEYKRKIIPWIRTKYAKPSNYKYILRKCTYDGKQVHSTSAFNSFIRGIGKDNAGNIYVLCYAEVIKMNKHLKVLEGTINDCAEHFGEAYGMLVTSDNVLVCSDKNDQITVLDLNLKFCYNVMLQRGPIVITKFHNKYIVTAKAAIGVIEIDFQNKLLLSESYFDHMRVGEIEVPFEPRHVLRGICASDRYIYVTRIERGSSIGLSMLCLQLEEENLKFICEENDSRNCCRECTGRCSPVVVFFHNNTIFYSQGSFGEMFHIIKAEHNPENPIKSTKMFDVI